MKAQQGMMVMPTSTLPYEYSYLWLQTKLNRTKPTCWYYSKGTSTHTYEYSYRFTQCCRLCFVVCWVHRWGRLPDFVILSLHILYRFLCVICTSARFNEPQLCVRVFVRPSVGHMTGQGDAARRHESSRVLFVTLSKSETYKETIVRVLVPQIRNRLRSTVQYSTDYALWWAGGDSPIS